MRNRIDFNKVRIYAYGHMEKRGNVLIIGGSSGLGLQLGLLLAKAQNVFIAGRKDPGQSQLNFIRLDINSFNQLSDDLDRIVESTAPINLLIYSAGFHQDGVISELADKDIANMVNVGLTAPAMLLQRILRKQQQLAGFIAITSTSQRMPRLREPLYAAAKAGLGMLAQSVSLDAKINKTLIVSPSGMQTNFWKGIKREGTLLEPQWVAEQILNLYQGDFNLKEALILREPPRVKIINIAKN